MIQIDNLLFLFLSQAVDPILHRILPSRREGHRCADPDRPHPPQDGCKAAVQSRQVRPGQERGPAGQGVLSQGLLHHVTQTEGGKGQEL